MLLVIIILILLILAYVAFGSKNARIVRHLQRGKNADQKKVIAYFVRSGALARLLTRTMSDDEYIEMVSAKVNSLNARQKAMEQTGLDEDEIKEITPINLVGYSYKNAWSHLTGANKWVSSRYQVTWIFFSASQLHLYRYSFDMDQDWKNELTEEFFYQDVTSVSTVDQTEQGKELINGIQTERTVQTSDFRIVVPGDKMFIAMNGNDLASVTQSVKAMKQMLREKKNA
jgi:hypothetical protein